MFEVPSTLCLLIVPSNGKLSSMLFAISASKEFSGRRGFVVLRSFLLFFSLKATSVVESSAEISNSNSFGFLT